MEYILSFTLGYFLGNFVITTFAFYAEDNILAK